MGEGTKESKGQKSGNISENAIPCAILAAALLAGFAGLAAEPGGLIVDGDRPWAGGGAERPIGNDLTGLFLPRHLWQSSWWQQGFSVPRWDPRGFAGRPNAGNPQAGIWYPPAWLAWTWGRPEAPGWLTVAHLGWAGLGALALGRAVGLGRAAATASGATLTLNPYVIAQVCEGHLPHVWSASWMPWALLGAVLMRRGRRAGRILLPTSLGLALLAGHPQEGAYLLLALVAWATVDAIGEARRPGRRPSGAGLAWWPALLSLGVGLAAVDWLPALRARPWVAGPLGVEGGGGSGPHHLHAANLWQLVSPRALGGPADFDGPGTWWETLCSAGWAPLVLAVIGAARGREAAGWLALLGASLVHAAGDGLGLAAVVGDLPGMGAARVPSRSLFLAATATAILAGLGVEAVARPAAEPRPGRWATRYGAAVAGLAVAVGLGVVVGPSARWASACGRIAGDGLTLASVLATGAGLAWWARRPADGRRAARFLAGVAVVELVASAAWAVPVSPPGRFLDRDAVSDALDRVRPPGSAPVRVRARDRFYSDLDAWRDGVEKTNLGDLFQLRRPAEIYRSLYPIFDGPGDAGRPLDRAPARSALVRLGVGLVITDRPVRVPVGPEVASGTRRGTRFSVLANPTALPRAYVVPRAEVVPDEGQGGALARLPAVDPREAVLMADDPLDGLDGPRQPFTPASYEAIGPDRVAVRVATGAPGLLVVLDAWMPGWSAEVDGRPAALRRGDHAMRVIPLPEAGRHEVVMTYRAPGLAAGASVTLASAAVMVAVARGGGRGGERREKRAEK